MSPLAHRPAVRDDTAAAAGVVIACEERLYGESSYSKSDLEADWEELDLAGDTLVLVDEDQLVAFGTLDDRGELWRVEAYVHPGRQGRGIGTELTTALEGIARSRGARRIQSGVAEPDEAGQMLLAALGYRKVRVFREMRIELTAEPDQPHWPDGLVAGTFDPDRDAQAFHAAHQDAFAGHWEFRPRDFESWRDLAIETERFDPALWSVVRDGDEIAAGAVCEPGRYGGGWVDALFTRRAWRGRGVGRALLQDAFVRCWQYGERSVGLGVDADGTMGAFHLYESAGMRPTLGWVMFEKEL
ncbi:MAG TPA: GNAT family N-acetyltransferase [Gaiellaceae bacterium]|nr:GNAT family N-acetyltransferase [Gaiellaceae bacterium]